MAHAISRSADVSVIITAYNHAHYLAEAIKSAHTQDCPVEIIVVDDGSKDDPSSVAKQFKTVKFLRQRNQGLSAARNTGLNVASREFIVFLDADDRLLPKAITRNLACFDEHKDAGLVYGGHTVIDQVGTTTKVVPVRKMTSPASELLLGNVIGMHCAVMYKRAALNAIGPFDTSLRACEDWDMLLRLSRVFRIASNEHSIAEYRKHGQNMSDRRSLILREALKVLDKHAREYKISSQELVMAKHSWRRFYSQSLAREVKRSASGEATPKSSSSSVLVESSRMMWLAPAQFMRALLQPASGSLLDRSLLGWELRGVRSGV